jgi:hypothetical protein
MVVYVDAAGTTRTIVRTCNGGPTSGIAVTFTPKSQTTPSRLAATTPPPRTSATPVPPAQVPPSPALPTRSDGGLPLTSAEMQVVRCYSGYTLVLILEDLGVKLAYDRTQFRQRRLFWEEQNSKLVMDRVQRLLGGRDIVYQQAISDQAREIESIKARTDLSVAARHQLRGELALRKIQGC